MTDTSQITNGKVLAATPAAVDGPEHVEVPTAYDAILLAGFGGPEGQDDVIPFLRNVTRGRGIPDVSAQAKGFVVNLRGNFTLVDGTSAACPTFASIVALLNDRRLTSGQPPLGFLNPLLYSRGAAAFNDIVVGSKKQNTRDYWPLIPPFACRDHISSG